MSVDDDYEPVAARGKRKRAPTPQPGAPRPDEAELALARLAKNDIGNGERLQRRHGRDLLHVEGLGWLAWDGMRWNAEAGELESRKRAHLTVKAIRLEALALEAAFQHGQAMADAVDKHWTWASTSGNRGRIEAMLREAQPYLARTITELDARPLLLNVANGTLDLSGPELALREPERDDLITRASPIAWDPEAGCPRFHRFLAEVQPDPDVRLWLQRWFGYCLTGQTGAQLVALFYGLGANGKSTLLTLIRGVMGGYALTLPFASFTDDERRSGGDATPDLVRLPGARLVLASEPKAGVQLSESMIKAQTGGEPMMVRPLFEKPFEFLPSHKLVLSFNNKPRVAAQDEGTWRRLVMTPWRHTVPAEKRDVELAEKLLAEEGPGILNWALDGYLLWREQGLRQPKALMDATQGYRDESDPVGDFLSACVERGVDGAQVTAKALYDAYCAFAEANGREPVSATKFGRTLNDLGFIKDKQGVVVYQRVRLHDVPERPSKAGRASGGLPPDG